MSLSTIEFTDENFKNEVLSSDKPVLVDFWAQWCGPCKMLTPIIDELADEFKATAKIGKVNVDENPTVASDYGIRSIPCLLFFKNGQVEKQIVGSVPKTELEETLKALI
jgi:thioredoxin 1